MRAGREPPERQLPRSAMVGASVRSIYLVDRGFDAASRFELRTRLANRRPVRGDHNARSRLRIVEPTHGMDRQYHFNATN